MRSASIIVIFSSAVLASGAVAQQSGAPSYSPPEITKVNPPPPPPSPVVPPAPHPTMPVPKPAPHARPAMPMGNPGNWATSNDYPAKAKAEGREGITAFRLTIGPDGRATECVITATSGTSELDEYTCRNMLRRGRFKPALDSNGNPTIGTWASRVRWILPTGPLPAVIMAHREPGTIKVSYLVGADGTVSDCAMRGGQPSDAAVAAFNPCATNIRITPYLDKDGKPVARRVTMVVQVKVSKID